MTVDWNNMELFTALSAATWDLAKGHFTPQAKAKIVADLQAIDKDVTWNGLRQHIQKLQKKEGLIATGDGSDSAAATPAPKRTPAKRKAAVKKAVKAGSDADDVDADTATPKKRRVARAPRAKKVKEAEAAEEATKQEPGNEDTSFNEMPNEEI